MVFEQFEGVFAPIPTPFSEKDLSINFNYIKKHLEFLNEKKIQGVVVQGTNGEFPSLSVEERKNVLAWVMKFRGNLRVLFQAGTSSFVETVGLCDYGKELGVDGFLIASPYYYKKINAEGIIQYYREILNRVQHPIFLYNMPQNTMVPLHHGIIEPLLSFSNLMGLKDSSGEWEESRKFIEDFRQLHIYIGNDLLFYPGLKAGAGGCITAASNTYPELVLSVFASFKTGVDSEYLHLQLSKYRRLISNYPLQAVSKYILYLRGFETAAVRPPLQDLTESQKRDLERGLDSLGFSFQRFEE
ncbi:MAG: dihydrodipicolinate synthase family protein [Candidatus Zhuqueibacterota bacterium]